MKIEEPKTPFEAYESDGEEQEGLDASLLAAKIAAEGNKGPSDPISKSKLGTVEITNKKNKSCWLNIYSCLCIL